MVNYIDEYTAIVGESAELVALEELASRGDPNGDVVLDVAYVFDNDDVIVRRFERVPVDYYDGAGWIRQYIEDFYREDVMPGAAKRGEDPRPENIDFIIYFDDVPDTID
jgi:hypothetical protein